ncbi:hypothetical protein GJ496_009065 [Pomphorhynchus laevis]|nr:hypothetical protein GJ496_009065 [Pomphorhynchus laevis]
MKSIISERNLNIIFYKLPEIHMHHQLFLRQYSNRITKWQDTLTIGDVVYQAFSKISIKDCYLEFISNYLSCQQTIRNCRRSSTFVKFLEQQSKSDDKHYNIDDLLIQPVQRIPRYELFIQDLIKCTSEHHPDMEQLHKAQTCIHDLAIKIDETKYALTNEAENSLIQLKESTNYDEVNII